MPKLKCIGGAADGQLANVHKEYNEHDQVNVATKLEFTLNTFEEDLAAFREGRVPKNSTVPYHPYKIVKIEFKDAFPVLKLHFLIPIKWELPDALRHMLMSHRPYDG